MTLIESDDSWLLWELTDSSKLIIRLAALVEIECDEPVERSAYASGPRLVSELDEAAHDEVVSSRLISRLVPAVN